MPRLQRSQRPQDRRRDTEAVHTFLRREGGFRGWTRRVAEQGHHHTAVHPAWRAVIAVERHHRHEQRRKPRPRGRLVPIAHLTNGRDAAQPKEPARLPVAVVPGDPALHRHPRRRAGLQLLPFQLRAGHLAAQPRLPRLPLPPAGQRAPREGSPAAPRLLRHRHDRLCCSPEGPGPAPPGRGNVPAGPRGYLPGYWRPQEGARQLDPRMRDLADHL